MKYLEGLEISISRKSFDLDIEALEDYLGEDIKGEKGYSIPVRDFKLSELHFLIDCVQASPFITQETANCIIEKIKALTSKYGRERLNLHEIITVGARCDVGNGLDNFDTIHESIAEKCRMSFQYFSQSYWGNTLPHRRKHNISPYAVWMSGGLYYLIAYEKNKIKRFRINKMDNVEKLSDDPQLGTDEYADFIKGERERESFLDMSERGKKSFLIFDGKEERVRIRFSARVEYLIKERFGEDISISKEIIVTKYGETIELSVAWVTTVVNPVFFGWLMGLGKSIMILEPENVADEYRKYIVGVVDMYYYRRKT